MKLSTEDFKNLLATILESYPDITELVILVQLELEENLDTIVGGNNDRQKVFDLIKWAQSQGKLEKLLEAVSQDRPDNNEVQETIKKLLEKFEYSSKNVDEHKIKLNKEFQLINDSVQKEKVSLEAIRNLKQILKLIDKNILAWSLLESLSYLALDTWLEKDKLMGLDSFIETIEENSPQLEYESLSLFKVVENLANHPQILLQTQNQLKSWFYDWTKENCKDITYSQFTPYLMVVISQERPNEKFDLMACLRIEKKSEIPIIIRSSLSEKTYEQNSHNPNLCTCKKWENVLDWLRDIIEISENFYLKGFPCAYELNIELFLPFDYLTEKIDLWKIKKQGRRGISLAEKYPCMIRAWDRLTDGFYSNQLEQIWSLIKNDKNFSIQEQLKRLEEEENYDYSLLESELFEKKKWGVTCNLPSEKADYEDLFYAILDIGVPLAMWVRPNSCNCEFRELLNQPIQVIEDLVKVIFEKRKKAHLYRRNPESKWAYHLVIWLDNPDRTPNISPLQTPNF